MHVSSERHSWRSWLLLTISVVCVVVGSRRVSYRTYEINVSWERHANRVRRPARESRTRNVTLKNGFVNDKSDRDQRRSYELTEQMVHTLQHKVIPFFECMNVVFPRQWFVSQGTLLKSLRYGGPVPQRSSGDKEDNDIDTFAVYDGSASDLYKKVQSMSVCLSSKEYYRAGFYWGPWLGLPTYYKVIHVITEPNDHFLKGYEVHFVTRDGSVYRSWRNDTFNADLRHRLLRMHSKITVAGISEYKGLFSPWKNGFPASVIAKNGQLASCTYPYLSFTCVLYGRSQAINHG